MKARRILFLALVLVLAMSTISVEAASSKTPVANEPWTAGTVKPNVAGITRLSTAFGGAFETPMMSYAMTGTTKIYQAHVANSTMVGNCGPNDTWFCTDWNAGAGFLPNTLSNMATERYGATTFGTRWAYQIGGMIKGTTLERYNNMALVTGYATENLIQLTTSKFGGSLMEPPSLVMDGGHYVMAAIICSGCTTDFPTYSLVYMHYTGNTPKTSCLDSGSIYQCDVIEEAIGYGSIHSASLQVAPDGTVGIAYALGRNVKYAYPHTNSILWPSNCGPGGNTWRCINIFAGTLTGTVGKGIKLAFGASGTDRGIAYTYDDTMIDVTLRNATYVGSGGNCGAETSGLGSTTLRWKCTDVDILGAFGSSYTPPYSIAVDPQGYSVIAYDKSPEDPLPFYLYLAYPRARAGLIGPGWVAQQIDGIMQDVDTGALASLSLDSTGYGFIGYLQTNNHTPQTDLKFALQLHRIFTPLIVR